MTHTPVLSEEVVQAFLEQSRVPVKILDGTFGRGGHATQLLEKIPRLKIVAFDRDQTAVAYAAEKFSHFVSSGRLQVIHDDFRNLSNHDLGLFDGALFDLGVSSPQLDEAQRGFSFNNDGPLDMRMDRTQDVTAESVLNESSEKELSDIFYNLGEIKRPNRVVRAVVHDRKTIRFTTTRQLASLIERVEGWRKKGNHPATNYFMALRIAVNHELEGLEEFFESMHLHLEPGGRLVVISFHSLEDRVVKWTFRKMHKNFGKIITKKVVIAGDGELTVNPRSRSAKLRIFEMGGHA